MPARAAAVIASLLALGACRHSEQPSSSVSQPARSAPASSDKKREVVLIDGGTSRVTIVIPPRLLPPPAARGRPRLTPAQKRDAQQEQRLRDSVTDLARYLRQISGVAVEVVAAGPDAKVTRLPLWIAEAAPAHSSEAPAHFAGKQGFRYTVKPAGIGLYGESDLATSYAIYELLHRLGCRWFMPGALGEQVPRSQRVSLVEADEALAPATYYRSVWYADEDFKRRNRLGGVALNAGHRLERWVSKEQREAHPEWRAVIKGVPDQTRLRWSNPGVADAIADAIDQQVAKSGGDSLSISPGDGTNFDESVDREIDAGDFDPTMNGVSLTDRLLVLANRVAEKTAKQHPDLLLGLLAYSSYTRPPVRERVHPNVVPVMAPITYCRQRPLNDDRCPGARELRTVVEGWSARASMLAYRSYGYNLAEPSAPNPTLAKWSYDLPFMFRNKVRFFQPETLPNFETTLPALYLGIRLAWNTELQPAAVFDELCTGFYGHACQAARAYLERVDRAWLETPDFSGGGLGYGLRFGPSFLKEARQQLNAALAACVTPTEKARVTMLDESLSQLELYMKMFWQLREGRLTALPSELEAWVARSAELSEKYGENFAFGKARWAQTKGIYAYYAERFLKSTYAEAGRIGREQTLLTELPICKTRFRVAPDVELPTNAPPAELTPSDATTDICRETWSTLGHHDYFGTMWYQVDVELAVASDTKNRRRFVWLSNVDGIVQVWVNGKPAGVRSAKADVSTSTETHLHDVTFELPPDASAAARVSIAVQRTSLAELGGGGLLGPVYVYRDR